MDPLDTLLHKAVRAGNIKYVKALILNGVAINAKNRYGGTSLCLAAEKNLVSIVQNGADTSARDYSEHHCT